MELPHIGQHCSDTLCKRLDFLPVKCDACQKIFCNDHYAYTSHNCPEAYKKDNQVPVCPLCNCPVSLGTAGALPDEVVGRHIDNDCQSETAQSRRKVYNNRCAVKGCKNKEVMPLKCDRCHKNFCLRHRHEMDHECRGFENSGRAMSSQGAAAIARANEAKKKSSSPQQSMLSSIGRDLDRERQQRQQKETARMTAVTAHSLQQPGLSEDEAVRRAMELSLQDSRSQSATDSSEADRQRQMEQDEALARALQQSEQHAAAQQPSTAQRQQQQQQRNVFVRGELF